MLLPIPGVTFDFASLSFHVPICGFAAKDAAIAANDRAVTTAVIRVFICARDSGRNAFRRQHQFQTIRQRQCPFHDLFHKNPRRTLLRDHGATAQKSPGRSDLTPFSRSNVCFLQFDENAPQLYRLFFICSAELKRVDTQSLHRQIGRERR